MTFIQDIVYNNINFELRLGGIVLAKKQEYGNESIKSLKGADRVRKRPAVIFGSDGLEGCEHSVFEIMSNSIDEAREGYGNKICVTRFLDGSVEVQDLVVVFLLITIKTRINITGNFFSAKCMQAVSTITAAITMNFRSV